MGLKLDTEMDDISYANKELGPERMKRDEEDIKQLMAHFLHQKVFDKTESSTLICIFTKVIASADICESILELELLGKAKLQEFVN